MSAVAFDLQPGWLRRHEVDGPHVAWHPDAGPSYSTRSFALSIGGEAFVLSIEHRQDPERNFVLPQEEPRMPTDQEILTAIVRAFLGSMPVYPAAEPDLEKGWDAYRREVKETLAMDLLAMDLLPWELMRPQLRECFAAGVRAAMEGGAR